MVNLTLFFFFFNGNMQTTHVSRYLLLIALAPGLLVSHSMSLAHTTSDAIKQSTTSSLTSIMLFTFLLTCWASNGHAFQVYKWVDEKGRVHFGDRITAPPSGKKVDIKVREPLKPQDAGTNQVASVAAATDGSGTPIRASASMPVTSPAPSSKKTSKPVDAARVPAACKGLIDQIAKVERGANWQALAKAYNEACPGIAYECNNFKREPEKNHCMWIERSDSTILSTNNYQ